MFEPNHWCAFRIVQRYTHTFSASHTKDFTYTFPHSEEMYDGVVPQNAHRVVVASR